MSKETFYFQHDYNSIQDPKMMSILMTCGLAGIGMYWIIIETLHQQENSKMLYLSYLDCIDFYGREDSENEQVLNNIKEMLINSKLLLRDGDYVYSERVLYNKKQREILSEKRSLAGKKSAEVRANLTSVEQNINKGQQGKERKGKERKVNTVSVGNFVPPTFEEVKAYCDERKNDVNPQRFVDFYTSKGWTVGKNSMKDWRAAVRSTWEKPKQEELKDISERRIL